MSILHFKKWKYVIVFCGAMNFVAPAFAQNLNVSGITAPVEANGTYTMAGTYSGFNYYSLTVGPTTYVIYNDPYSGGSRYWNLDTDFNDEGTGAVLFYSSVSTATIPTGLSWSPDVGVGSLTVTSGTPTPDIAVSGDGRDILDGSTTISSANFTNIGSASISGGTASRIFTIKNTGSSALTISGSSPYVNISGANASSFSVTAAPAPSIAASTGTTTFTITFTPSSEGYYNAVITINSNDPDDEGIYTFNIQGYGFVARSVVVSGITEPSAVNGTYIHLGVINNFQYWKHQTLNYYLYFDTYSGGGYWDIDNNTDDAAAYFFNASENGTPVGLTGWSLATSGFSPLPTGSPVISLAVPAPEINLKGNNTSIAINDITPSFTDHTTFGSVNISIGSRTRTYTIENTGGAALTISGVSLGGTNASEFSKTNPVITTVPASGTTTFTVTFDPSTEGTKTATISIASNDADENPYLFYISGDAFTQKNLFVSDITTPSGANGTYIYQGILNEFQYWKHESQNYYVYNSIYANQCYWNVDVDLVAIATDDFLFSRASEGVAPVGLTGWTLGAGATGAPTIVYAGPEMEVRGNSTVITDGDATPSTSDYTDFGSVAAASGTILRTFTINNTGNGSLNLNGTPIVAKSGTNAADFTITHPSSTTLAALTGTITFTVEFNPSGVGSRTAELSIANDDSDENPYNFSIQGTGTNTAPTATAPTAPTVSEDATNVALADDIQVSDIDGDAQTVSFTITGGTVTLGTTGITFGGGGNGSSSFTAQGTFAAINTALDAATFTPTANLNGTNAGTISFTTNDGTLTSSAASVTFDITSVNDAPTLTSFAGVVETTTQNTEIEITLAELKAQGNETDVDGTVDDFVVKVLSTGTLRIGANSATATVFNATTNKTIDATNNAYWIPPTLFVSVVQNAFTVTVMDNNGAESSGEIQATVQVNYTPPSIAFNSTNSSGAESISSANLQVDLSASSGLTVTVDYTVTGTATGGGIDYTLANGTLTITAGNTTNNITIAGIVEDLSAEADETVIVTLSNPTNATLGTNTVHVYTIEDNDIITNINDIPKNKISVYPNPFTNVIYFKNIRNDISCIIIYDLSGKPVLKADYNGEKDLDISDLISGVYLLTFVNNNGEKQMIKIVKK